MAIAKCRECKAEVSDQAKVCPSCGVPKPVKKTPLILWILAGLFTVGFVGQTLEKMFAPDSKAPAAQAAKAPAAPAVQTATAPQPAPSLAALVDPAAERATNKAEMERVRKDLAQRRERLKGYYANKQMIAAANSDGIKLAAIILSRGASKSPEDQKQANEAKGLAAQLAEQNREMYANVMEESFIKNGIDAKVRAGGKAKDTLTITYALMSQPMVYKMRNEMDVEEMAKKIGFAKAVYTNGFESSLGQTWSVKL